MTLDTQHAELEALARRIRCDILQMLIPPKVGHLGGSLSCAEIIAVLYGRVLRHDPVRPNWPERDRFIMSKGHSALTQYAALAEYGYFPIDDIIHNKELGFHLQGHPDIRRTPGIEANTGSLGQGLSIGLGMSLAAKLDGSDHRIYVLLGDGELSEGQVWEAVMACAAYKADNLMAIVDHNKLQATGPIADRMEMKPLSPIWEAFGWHVIEADGHDIGALMDAFDSARSVNGKPTVLIAHTIKGKGIPFAEGNSACHNSQMSDEEFTTACRTLGIVEKERCS